MSTVQETDTGYAIKCPECNWHEFPKHRLSNGASWTFNGDYQKPTFSPSMNECINPTDSPDHRPDVPTKRCHFIVTDGVINFCGDCTHAFAGKSMPLEHWAAVRTYATMPSQASDRIHLDQVENFQRIWDALGLKHNESIDTALARIAQLGEFAAMIDELRSEEGDSVEILCDNPDPTSDDEGAAVECCGDWTNWEHVRYYGKNLRTALIHATNTKAKGQIRKP